MNQEPRTKSQENCNTRKNLSKGTESRGIMSVWGDYKLVFAFYLDSWLLILDSLFE